jgi:hypothetical protein
VLLKQLFHGRAIGNINIDLAEVFPCCQMVQPVFFLLRISCSLSGCQRQTLPRRYPSTF